MRTGTVAIVVRRSTPPGSQSSLREANRARLLDSLKRHGRLTQIELAGNTGLSPATVSNIVKELTASGILHTSFTSRSGRRATLVSFARQVGLVAGVHFSSRQLRIAIADATRTIVAENTVPLAPGHRHDAELDRLSIILGDMMDTLGGTLADLLAVGLAVPAPIDPRTGMVSTPGLLPGWEGIDIAESLSARIDRPVYVDSEANLGGLAEAREGSGRSASSSVYIRVGHTISAGLIVGGDLFRGASGKTGQIGHVTIDENGPLCRCSNRGCLETYAAGPALLALFPESEGMQRLGDLIAAAEDGVGGAQRVIADAGRHIGIAAASLCNLFDPELIVVGGELAQAGEILMAPMRHALERSALAATGGLPEIVGASFGEWAECRGAIATALDHVRVDADVLSITA
ncbi:Sugar kinase of the NBD/HSP70 family, may contain an N-terminal HTH domain [Microbacterium saccharophilum]|uniref:Sugar kinase of the NBD/HSP70 family, may contain an N-terminal HTH domain n=1 Tax=Microbacterium saccharophilum TaxID=1213358 RepID=A0A7Z7CW58_9MICO|nr:Sugar kinase of the NBD/HSP70 family, may contain an N-terminal HTH domain [Microbacterium saccharophilum]